MATPKTIRATVKETDSLVEQIAHMIYTEIYPAKGVRCGRYTLSFDRMVDDLTVSRGSSGLRLKVLTDMADPVEKSAFRLITDSIGQATVVLAATPYCALLQRAMRIRSRGADPEPTGSGHAGDDPDRDTQEADRLEAEALDQLKLAFLQAEFYIHGESVALSGEDVQTRLDQAMTYLAEHVYSRMGLLSKTVASGKEIWSILNGVEQRDLFGYVPNQDACAEMEEYLKTQRKRNLSTSILDIQTRYQAAPYGWRNLDVAAVIARLIRDLKVTVKLSGQLIAFDDPELPGMLCGGAGIGRTQVQLQEGVERQHVDAARRFLAACFDDASLPEDEDGLFRWLIDAFSRQKVYYVILENRYKDCAYPDHRLVSEGRMLTEKLLSLQWDRTALVTELLEKQDAFISQKQKMEKVEVFFSTRKPVFDSAVQMLEEMKDEFVYLNETEEAREALEQIRSITQVSDEELFDYSRIEDLPAQMATVREVHARLLAAMRAERLESVRQCMALIHNSDPYNSDLKPIIQKADSFYIQKKTQIAESNSLADLDTLLHLMLEYRDQAMARIVAISKY